MNEIRGLMIYLMHRAKEKDDNDLIVRFTKIDTKKLCFSSAVLVNDISKCVFNFFYCGYMKTTPTNTLNGEVLLFIDTKLT